MKYIKEYNEFGYNQNCDLFDDGANELPKLNESKDEFGIWRLNANNSLYKVREIFKDDEFSYIPFSREKSIKSILNGLDYTIVELERESFSIHFNIPKRFEEFGITSKYSPADVYYTIRIYEHPDEWFQFQWIGQTYATKEHISKYNKQHQNLPIRFWPIHPDKIPLYTGEFIQFGKGSGDAFSDESYYLCDQWDSLVNILKEFLSFLKTDDPIFETDYPNYNINVNESKELADMIKKMFDDREKSYVSKVSSLLYSTTKDGNEYWKYLGERNGGEWGKNIDELLNNQTYRVMEDSELLKISEWLKPVLSVEEHKRGWNPNTYSYQDWAQYPTLKSVQNSRFENCWFMKQDKDWTGIEYGWDMCVQAFSDEWYLINVGDGRGYKNYWYRVDTLEGLHKFIMKNFIEPWNETH